MPVQDVSLSAIDARRYAKPNERNLAQVRIDHNSTVTLVEARGDDLANVEFRYTASYGNLGVIRLEGILTYQGDAKALKERWDADNEMPTDVASEIHTTVMRVCVPEAVGIAKNLQLPPPIPLPQVQFPEQGGSGRLPPGGPEVA